MNTVLGIKGEQLGGVEEDVGFEVEIGKLLFCEPIYSGVFLVIESEPTGSRVDKVSEADVAVGGRDSVNVEKVGWIEKVEACKGRGGFGGA